MHVHPNSDRVMGTYIHWVLLFAWVLLFRNSVATGLIGTYIHRVLVHVSDGYLRFVPWYMGFIQWQSNRQVRTMYGPILLEHAGSGPNMQSRYMYYATTRIYEGANCGFVVTLCYRLAAACPSTVWYCNNCLPLHTQRKGKFSVAFPE